MPLTPRTHFVETTGDENVIKRERRAQNHRDEKKQTHCL